MAGVVGVFDEAAEGVAAAVQRVGSLLREGRERDEQQNYTEAHSCETHLAPLVFRVALNYNTPTSGS